MRSIVLSAFTSLDGVMQAPGGPQEDPTGDFTRGGWVAALFDPSLGSIMDEVFARPFDLLLGRKTYDIFAAHWPYAGADAEPLAGKLNRATKYVASRTEPRLPWAESRWLGRDPIGTLRALKQSDGPDLVIQGSSDFLQSLWPVGLIDVFSVLIFPVVLGNGKRLFGHGAAPCGLKLESSTALPNGVVVARYRPDGPVSTADFSQPEPSAAELERRRTLR